MHKTHFSEKLIRVQCFGLFYRDKLPPNNNSLRVPILPPIVPSPTSQVQGCFPSQNQIANSRPTSKTTSRQRSKKVYKMFSYISYIYCGFWCIIIANSFFMLYFRQIIHQISTSFARCNSKLCINHWLLRKHNKLFIKLISIILFQSLFQSLSISQFYTFILLYK